MYRTIPAFWGKHGQLLRIVELLYETLIER